jgi:hypothetical protein
MHCVSENWVCRKNHAPTLRHYLLQDFAYSYRVWITLIKLLYASVWSPRIHPDIHQGERLYGSLLPSVPLVSEKSSSRKFADQARLPTPRYRIGMRVYGYGFPRMSLLGISVNRGIF